MDTTASIHWNFYALRPAMTKVSGACLEIKRSMVQAPESILSHSSFDG